MKVLFDVRSNTIYAHGHTIERGYFDTDLHEKYKVMDESGNTRLFLVCSPFIAEGELADADLPADFVTGNYKFDGFNLTAIDDAFMSSGTLISYLSSQLSQLTAQLNEIQESQDNQDAILSAMIEMM